MHSVAMSPRSLTLSRGGRVAAGVVAATAWIGLIVQFQASHSLTGPTLQTLWIMSRYFTVVATFLVAVAFTIMAMGRINTVGPVRLGGITLAVLLVGIVYATLLRGMVELSGGAQIADILNHEITPMLVGVFWLLFAPKGGLTRRDPWVWSLIPAGYFVYALMRGAAEGTYAYPFLNIARIGWAGVLGYGTAMAAGFLAAGYGLVWLDARLARSPGNGIERHLRRP